MFLVAIAELRGDIGGALKELSAELGTTPYDLRLVLNAGFPAVVLATVDGARAGAASAAVARHGHIPVLLDRRSVVASADMTELVRFKLTKSSVVADERAPAELPFADIGALVRALHRGTTTTT